MKKLLLISIVLLFISEVEVYGEFVSNGADGNEKSSETFYSRLHKCNCYGNQILVDNVCKEYNTSITAFVDDYTLITQEINTSSINNIEVAPLVCPPNYFNLTLPGDSFILKSSGELFNSNYGLVVNFPLYCVEHTLNENQLNMDVHICLPAPQIPKCCLNDSYNGESKQCNSTDNSDVKITFSLGLKQFHMTTKSFPNDLKCQESENLVRVPLISEGSISHLKLTNEGLILSQKTSIIGSTVYIPSPEYCIETSSENNAAEFATFCPIDLTSMHLKNCIDNKCVRKCCNYGDIFDRIDNKCVPVDKSLQWSPVFHNSETHIKEIEAPKYNLVYGLPLDCEFFSLSPNNDIPDFFELLSNGSLYVNSWKMILPPDNYCLDNFRSEMGTFEEAMVCFQKNAEPKTKCDHVESKLYPALVIVSCVFLSITLVVYAIIPDLHCKVQGKCLISSILALLAAYIILIVVQLASSLLPHFSCIFIGLLLQYTFLASFLWINVMSFDIWKTLRSMKTGRESPSGARRRFLLYSLYAWGCPAIITAVTAVMQFLPNSVDKSNLILPRIGETDCFFPKYDKTVFWTYFYSFIVIILVLNTLFFIHLAYTLIKAQKFSESALGKKNQLHKEWAKLYLKLFMVMGITWIFEVIAFIEGTCAFWTATDILNALRGFLIFLIFVCKGDVLRKLASESSPAFHRMRTTVRQSSSFFSRSSKRTSNIYVDPTTTDATHEATDNQNHADIPL